MCAATPSSALDTLIDLILCTEFGLKLNSPNLARFGNGEMINTDKKYRSRSDLCMRNEEVGLVARNDFCENEIRCSIGFFCAIWRDEFAVASKFAFIVDTSQTHGKNGFVTVSKNSAGYRSESIFYRTIKIIVQNAQSDCKNVKIFCSVANHVWVSYLIWWFNQIVFRSVSS